MEIRLVSSLEKAGIGKEPEALRNAGLSALQGETVSFQILFRDSSAGRTEQEAAGTAGQLPDGGQSGRVKTGVQIWETRQGTGEQRAPVGETRQGTGEQRTPVWETRKGTGEQKAPEAGGTFPGAASAGRGLPAVRLRRVLPVMCRYSCKPDSTDEDYLFYESRMAPDLLRDVEPEESIPLTGEWQSLWVDICPGRDCRAGSYRVVVTLQKEKVQGRTAADGKASVSAEVELWVIGAPLISLPIPHTEWFHCDGIIDYYGVEAFSEEFWRIFRNFLAVYVKRGGNTILTPVLTPPLDTEVGGERTTVQLVDVERSGGEYRLGFRNLERFLDICLEEGIRNFEICHLFTQWGAAAAPKVMALADGRQERIFGWDTPSDDPEYLRFLSILLPALRELMERRGLLQNTFFHVSDEPDLEADQYKVSQRTVRELLKGCTIIEAVTDYVYYEKGLVDIPVCAVDHIEPFLEKRPPKLWAYYCCAQTQKVPNRFISMPSWRNRIYGVLLYWHKIDGILHWGYNFYNSGHSKKRIDPYETVDADGCFPAGDPFLVYPGRNGVPEESIRLMVLEEGLNDYCALRLLEEVIGREQVMALIRLEAGMELSFTEYPRNAEFILRLREKVNRLLVS